jgi:hypothetical protein
MTNGVPPFGFVEDRDSIDLQGHYKAIMGW